jgi:hypothetical protein
MELVLTVLTGSMGAVALCLGVSILIDIFRASRRAKRGG